jgi:hypothetical protein
MAKYTGGKWNVYDNQIKDVLDKKQDINNAGVDILNLGLEVLKGKLS